MGSIAATSITSESDGSYGRKDFNGAFGNSYNNTGNDATTGELITAASLGLAFIIGVDTPAEESGYGFQILGLSSGSATSVRVKVFQGGAGTTGGTTVTGTNATSNVPGQIFTGMASALNTAAPVFSGTGQSSAGQVITTTDNQTMALNQCAGMWFVSATHGPFLIASNTAVVAAPAVLTIYGTAPTTDAGTYKIVATIPVGTNAAATAAAQIWTATGAHTHAIGAGAGGEVPNGTNLSVSLASVRFTAFGK